MAGMVYLVGAGPGDYRLISLKAVDCLKRAEVVVYDRLADDRILGWAPRDAEFIYVGKASSHHTMKQPDINQLLVDKAKEGKIVVRLKGGDPFVFGRGGEEGLLLEENGLPNLAQIFTRNRYRAEDNLAISRNYFALLKKQGFFNN